MDETEAGSSTDEDLGSEVAAEVRDVAEEPVTPASGGAPEQESEAPDAIGTEGEQLPLLTGEDEPLVPAMADEALTDGEQARTENEVPAEADATAPEAEEASTEESEVPSEAEAEAESAPEAAPDTTPTLDELVAELAASEPAAESADESGTPAAAGEESASDESAEGGEGGESAEGGAVEGAASDEAGEEAEAAQEPEGPVVRRMSTHIPFWVLGVLWVAFAGGLTYLLWPTSTGVFVTNPIYGYFVFGGATLVIVGLVLGLVVWLSARSSVEKGERGGIAGVIWMRALGWTAIGVALWWVALTVLDLHRTGVIH